MAPRARGRPAAKGKAEKPVLPPGDVITVPVNEDGSPPPESTTSTQTSKKQKTTKDIKEKTNGGNEDPKPYVRGKAALKVYWDELANVFPSGPDADTLKQAVQHLRKIAITELKKKDVFKIHGLCEMRVRHIKGRVATKSTCFGKDIEMKAKPPRKRVYAKVVKDLSDCVVKEMNT